MQTIYFQYRNIINNTYICICIFTAQLSRGTPISNCCFQLEEKTKLPLCRQFLVFIFTLEQFFWPLFLVCRRAGSKKGCLSLPLSLALSLSVSLASSSQCVPHPQSQSAYAYACIWVNITAPRANRGQHKKPLLVYVWLGTGSLPLCADRPEVRGDGGGDSGKQTKTGSVATTNMHALCPARRASTRGYVFGLWVWTWAWPSCSGHWLPLACRY